MNKKRRMPAGNSSSKEEVQILHEECLRVQDEIWRVVAEARRCGSFLRLGPLASTIEGSFPESGLSTRNIADALIFAAVDAGVPVERAFSALPRAITERPSRFSFAALRSGVRGGRPGTAASSTSGSEARA